VKKKMTKGDIRSSSDEEELPRPRNYKKLMA
jgi:hypothetical protein